MDDFKDWTWKLINQLFFSILIYIILSLQIFITKAIKDEMKNIIGKNI
ncbi:hypothetical protein [Streptococcus parauberis]